MKWGLGKIKVVFPLHTPYPSRR